MILNIFFGKQLHFLLQSPVAYSQMNFWPESCLAIGNFQPLLLTIAYKFMLSPFALIGGFDDFFFFLYNFCQLVS